jgi:predicted pyridoxine 5'-phosphate oxidase superfamily flavin-nucleotide-binding protein
MPIEMTDDMAEQVNKARENNVPCLLATASADGEPDVAIRGSVMVYDKEHLAYWERSLNESLANLRENPNVVVFFRNPATRAQWRFYGVATLHEGDDPMREQIMARVIEPELAADPERKGFGVSIRVDRIRQGNNVLMER